MTITPLESILQELQELQASVRIQTLPPDEQLWTFADRRNAYWREVAEYEYWVTPLYLRLENIQWEKILSWHISQWQRQFVRSLYHLKKECSYRRSGMFWNSKTKSGRLIQRDRLLVDSNHRIRLSLPILTPVENAYRQISEAITRYGEVFTRIDEKSQSSASDSRKYLADNLKFATLLSGRHDAQNLGNLIGWELDWSVKQVIETDSHNMFGLPQPSAVGETLARVVYFWQCLRDFNAVEVENALPSSTPSKVEPAPNRVFDSMSLLVNLHPVIQNTASQLFSNKHYRQAVLDSCIALDNAVSSKAQRPDLHGSSMMDKVFSPKKPILKLSENEDEQLGFLMLFKGAILAIRNPKAHSLTWQNDAQHTLEWLSFASVLLRILDEAELVLPV